MKKYKDFGKKIGGARKDLWKGKITLREIEGLDTAEVKKYVNKDNIFPKPDYSLETEDALTVLYWKKLIRDAVPCKPVLWDLNSPIAYFDAVNSIKIFLSSIHSASDFETVEKESLKQVEQKVQDGFISTTRAEATKKRKLISLIKSPNWNTLEGKRLLNGFLCSMEEQVKANTDFYLFNIKENTGPNYQLNDGNRYNYTLKNEINHLTVNIQEPYLKKDTFSLFANYKGIFSTVGINIENIDKVEQLKKSFIEEQMKLVKEKKINRKNSKKKLMPPMLDHIERTGKDVIGVRNITGNNYINEFGIYGGEYGNWLNQKERKASLYCGYEAFRDLAEALNINDNDISLGGRLSIAFGSRGHGTALAHYEPLREVINLTKMKGAGSLAHEWGHALDYILGTKLFGQKLISSNNYIGSGVINVMKYNGHKETEFYKNAKALDQYYSKSDKGYWSSPTEMFARCFACYVYDKLQEKGQKNDYLCGHAYRIVGLDADGNPILSYPTGEEKDRIFSEFDLMFNELKNKGLLTERKEDEVFKTEEFEIKNMGFPLRYEQMVFNF